MFVCKPDACLLSAIMGQMIFLYVKGYSYLVSMYKRGGYDYRLCVYVIKVGSNVMLARQLR